MTIREKEDAIFSKLREADPSIVADGIVCEEKYLDVARLKIVFVLKEVNGGQGWDLRDFLLEGGRAQTWDTVARWTEAILECRPQHSWDYWENGCEERRKKYLPYIGAINLKKTAGKHTSVAKEVSAAAQQFKETVSTQIALYEPDIIICGGTSTDFCKNCYPDTDLHWKRTERGVWYAEISKQILISFAHPEARVGASILHYALVDAVYEILSKRE